MHSGGFPLLLYPGIIYVNLELFISWKISKTQQRSSVSPGLFSQLDAFSTSVSISLMGIGLFRYFIVSWVCGSVQSLSRVRLFATPWIAARHASLAITNSRSSPRLTSIESVMPSSHLILCRPLLLPTIPPSMSLFQWVSSSHEVAKVLEFQLYHHSFPKKSRGWSPSEWTGWISLQSKGLSRVFSNTTVQKHQFFGDQLSSQSNSHNHTWPQEKP